jgi:hypothetical protein
VFNPRPDCALRCRKQLLHCHSHHVSSSGPHTQQMLDFIRWELDQW